MTSEPADTRSAGERAVALKRQGTEELEQGQSELARTHLEQALELGMELGEPDDPTWLKEAFLWEVLGELSAAEVVTGQTSEALASLWSATALLEKWLDKDPDFLELVGLQARYLLRASNLAFALGQDGSGRVFEGHGLLRAREFAQKYRQSHLDSSEDRRTPFSQGRLATAIEMQAYVERRFGEQPGSRAAYEEAIRIRREQYEASPEHSGLRLEYSRTLRAAGQLERAYGQVPAAKRLVRKATATVGELVDSPEAEIAWLLESARCSLELGALAFADRAPGRAESALGFALELLERLCALDSGRTDFRILQARCLHELSIATRQRRGPDRALPLLQRALWIKQQLHEDEPEVVWYAGEAAHSHWLLARWATDRKERVNHLDAAYRLLRTMEPMKFRPWYGQTCERLLAELKRVRGLRVVG